MGRLSRRERRERGLLLWQLVIRAWRIQSEGGDVKSMAPEELAAALAGDLREDGFLDDIDWERVIELILEYAPVIIQLIISLL